MLPFISSQWIALIKMEKEMVMDRQILDEDILFHTLDLTSVEWKRMVCVMPQSAKKEEKKTNASQDSSQQYHYKGLETRRSQINEISMVRSFLKTNEKPSYIQTRQQSVQP